MNFGLTVDEIPAMRESYDPQAIIDADEDFTRVMRLLDNGHFNRFEPRVLEDVIRAVRDPRDPWLTAADFRSFVDAQVLAAAAYTDTDRWTKMSILNTAASGQLPPIARCVTTMTTSGGLNPSNSTATRAC